MRVAFVGKGGSGKSTLTALFYLHILEQMKTVLLIDADLNIHLPQLLNVTVPEHLALSLSNNASWIREHLRGNSKHIHSIDHIYKTTPPSKGVNLLELRTNDPILSRFTTQNKTGFIAIIGTYEKNEIGRSCYHTNLSILENLLSFAKLELDEWIVVDMVAGIDAFSNTLHQQFDLLVLTVEPTHESVSVYKQYIELAQHAQMENSIIVIGNKIEDSSDNEYLKSVIDARHYLGGFKKLDTIKSARRNQHPLSLDLIQDEDRLLLERVQDLAVQFVQDPNDRLKTLHKLHLHYIAQDYVRNAAGDLSHQIDQDFSFTSSINSI